jgi:hypothetical protein
MKINILYIFCLLALGAVFFIGKNLKEQSGQQLFGIAETEGQTVKVESPVFIQKNYLTVGKQVKKGDTVMVLFRSELNQKTTEKIAELNQLETERTAKNSEINKDAELFVVRQNARIAEFQAQIKVLQSEIGIQNSLKEAIGNGSNSSNNNVKLQEIKSLEDAISQIYTQTKEQAKVFDNQKVSNDNISFSKVKQIQNELTFIGNEKTKLVLFAPYDGFIEQVFVVENEVAQSYKDLYKINPHQPNKITGFIHESLNVNYRLGDTVVLSSSVRPLVTCKAQLIGASPKLVELPFRLRRNIEIKSWGREIYINLPPNNEFFIGEKITIRLNHF